MVFEFKASQSTDITIRFICPYCQQEVTSKTIPLSLLKNNLRKDDGIIAKSDHDAICENCEEEFPFILTLNNEGGTVEFEDNGILNIRTDTL